MSNKTKHVHGTGTAYARGCRCEKCRVNWRVYVREHQRDARRRNRSWLVRYLLNHPCVDCGMSDPRVLQFDHVRGKKLNTIGRCINDKWSIGRIESEIAKCEVRCASCHQRVTAERGNFYSNLEPETAKLLQEHLSALGHDCSF